MSARRTDASATLLADGCVLVAGGAGSTARSPNGEALDTAELFDPVARTWTPTGRLTDARQGHVAVLLDDGRVLVLGGQPYTEPCTGLASEVWSPRTGTWTRLPPMKHPRCPGAVALLRDGRVLVAGGDQPQPGVFSRRAVPWVELWNPATGQWSETADLPARLGRPVRAFPLAGGRVLVTGVRAGDSQVVTTAILSTPSLDLWSEVVPPYEDAAFVASTPEGSVLGLGARPRGLAPGSRDEPTLLFWDPLRQTVSFSEPLLLDAVGSGLVRLPDGRVLSIGRDGYSQLWYPDGKAVGHWTTSGPLFPDNRQGATVTALTDGRALVLGGRSSWPESLSSGFAFQPGQGWEPISAIRFARLSHSATVMTDGRVLVAGGEDERRSRAPTLLRWPWHWLDRDDPSVLSSSEVWNPRTRRWSSGGLMVQRRSGHAAVLLRDGRVLVVGGGREVWEGLFSGTRVGQSLDTAEIWDPRAGIGRNAWTATSPMRIERSSPRAVTLPDGRILIVGGTFAPTPAEVWDAATGAWSLLPELVTAPEAAVAVLRDGRVLIAGGRDDVALDSTRIWQPASRRVVPTGALNIGRTSFVLQVLPDSRVLAFGGDLGSGGPCLARAEVWDPASGVWAPTPPMRGKACGASSILQPDGGVLVVGAGRPQTWSP